MKIDLVVGARPNFMKAAPVVEELRGDPEYFRVRLIHTGQHYDVRMSQVFFQDLSMPEPDIYLGVGSGTHGVQTAKVMIEYEKVLLGDKPDLVLVVGDVNSTLACSLVAVKLGVRVGHIEAGVRSFDWEMPEEINRLVTDTLSEFLFTPTVDADQNLLKEGHSPDQIHRVGNVMIDSLLKHREKAEKSPILTKMGLEPQGYVLVTLHRPANVDAQEQLKKFMAAFAEIQERIPIVFPVHPRTQKMIRTALGDPSDRSGPDNLQKGSPLTEGTINRLRNLKMTDPVGYLDFIKLQANARLVLTDSGGIQAETTVLNVPCLTLRKNTEWPITLERGTNTLVGAEPEGIVGGVQKILSQEFPPGREKAGVPELWDGKTAKRIVGILKNLALQGQLFTNSIHRGNF